MSEADEYAERPTPITDAEWQAQCCSGASWYRIAEGVKNRAADLERKLVEVTKQRDELQEWVDSQKSVDSTWNPQVVADLLGIRLGQRIRENIQPKIEELIQKLAEVTKQRDALMEALKQIASGAWGWKTCVDVIAPKAIADVKGGGQ